MVMAAGWPEADEIQQPGVFDVSDLYREIGQ